MDKEAAVDKEALTAKRVVRILGPSGRPLKGQFAVVGSRRAMVEVMSLQTGRTFTIHCTRICRKGTTVATPKVKAVAKPFDFKALGGERWTKQVKFDHKSIRAEAHVVIVGRRYLAFNTYNGSTGRGGAQGTQHKLEDYDALVARLTARGYKKVRAVRVAKTNISPSTVKPEAQPPTPPVQPVPAPAQT
jgi:hypothetical protein